MLNALLSGFALGGSLIVAIGAQNAYVLRMGLLNHHVFWLALFCAVSDALLIVIGIAGLGAIIGDHPLLLRIVAALGAAFLAAYAMLSARRALHPAAMHAARTGRPPLLAAIAACATFTWLNPHVYLDTVVLVGGFSTRYDPAIRPWFGAGAVLASFVWFFSLGYGARHLAPLFARPSAWRVLDSMIALVMAFLALTLAREAWTG